jgi:Zn-dependent peptidase ImmA (M78 family)
VRSYYPEPTSEDIIRVLLQKTNQKAPPTNPGAIAAYLNLNIQYFEDHSEYGLDEKVRAFIWPRKKLIGVHNKLSVVQKRFSILHEIAHFILPGHLDSLLNDEGQVTDSGRTLSNVGLTGSISEKTIVTMEIEANQFAADALFQLEQFDRDFAISAFDWTNAINTAQKYNASIEATARRWIERSSLPLAMIAFNPVNRVQPYSPLEIMYTITSKRFSESYFAGLARGQRASASSAVYKLFYNLYGNMNTAEEEYTVQMGETEDEVAKFDGKLFTNSYRVFSVLSPKPDPPKPSPTES